MNKNVKKLIIISSLLTTVVIGSYFLFKAPRQETIDAEGIVDFSDSRDTDFILNIFDCDWHWLISEYSKGYDPKYTLQYRTSSHRPEDRGNLSIKMGYDGDKPVGFVAYYKKTFYAGYLLFLDVIPEYRAKGWGAKLAKYAVHDLIKRGAQTVGLVTRTTNHAAQKLYKRLGFKEVARDEGFVDFEYRAP